jgi:hypothetical protein
MNTVSRILIGAVATVLVGEALGPATALGQSDELPLSVGITGSTPAEDTKNPTFMLGSASVQRLILDITDRPRDRAFVEAGIAGMPFTIDDMVTVGLLREEEGLYWIDFNLLRVEDQENIISASEQLGRDLARAYLAQREGFAALADAHGFRHQLRGELFYIVLGCFSLDWDGLDLTEERGYRAGAQRTINGHSFTPWAKERGAAVSLKGLYWGSHNRTGSQFTFTTFGDHHTLPRFGLPDITWNTGGTFTRYAELPAGRRAARRLLAAYMGEALDDIAGVMIALRERDRSLDQLQAATGIEQGTLERVVQLLEAAAYVEAVGERYRSTALVLVPDDADLVSAMLAKGREIMVAWHTANYDAIRAQLAELTPLRNGVPFERVYTEVWHFVFGITNRTLVEEGFFADPYDHTRQHQGFVPAIFANGIAASP